ncbi:bacterial low temperature requirement A protein-domain-containing protein [Podospora didyma]|uniref:Bacterial low temperature requirement A protein-domain-containing protein n=1 Tax=Podospora didyma TaxID=330526 RepID=A0AAE0KEK4_9PEZI|nr:bacterial low temperature requirement A protein-domain-containing protein [Podospora didyma]
MGPLHRKPKALDEERGKRRIHNIVPWIQNPLQGVDKEHLVFAPRHEASTLELFFDLFFVANLATFTTYHAISDHSSLFAYIGFFSIIWVTWFHTVLHDVRFENDSIYSRACKTVIMAAFVGFALVGSAFSPGTEKGDNTNFRVLCYTLVLSRVLFIIQYLVVGVYVGMARRTDIFLPLFLNILTYVIAAGAYGAMIPSFSDEKPVDQTNGIYSVWWVVMLIETIATIGISCFWRMLSFKKTHLVERMGLLTLIVIGEGAIGVTKTISRIMGKQGLDPEGSGLTLCIVLILMGLWMIYFDNHPHGHFGTIKQQIWSALHFPIHLAIVGLVEGAQQIALARYMSRNLSKLEKSFVQYCFKDHLDGAKLAAKLDDSIAYFHLEKKLQSSIFLGEIENGINEIGNSTGICGKSVTGSSAVDLPDLLFQLYANTWAAMYNSLGLSMPSDKDDDTVNIINLMFESWKLIYRYFWGAFLILMLCFLIVMFLIRKNKTDAFDLVSLFTRGTMIVIAAALIGVSASKDLMYRIIETPSILPLATSLLFLTILLDRIGAWVANRRNRKSGEPLTGHGVGDHGHGGHGGHGHEEDASHGHGDAEKHPGGVQVGGVATETPTPLSHRSSYNPLGGTGVMPSYFGADASAYSSAYSSAVPTPYDPIPPVQAGGPPTYMHHPQQHPTPPPQFSTNTAYVTPSGYSPVNNPQYGGAPY